MTDKIRRFLVYAATDFGVGYWRPASGTWGTLVTLPLVWLLSLGGPLVYMGFTVLFLPFSIVAAELYEQQSDEHDSSNIVIDESIGILITMTWLPITWKSLLAGFLLFRVLDILKPFPIGYLDKKLKGGLGVVADDVAAGIIASLILQYIYTHTLWLGVRLG